MFCSPFLMCPKAPVATDIVSVFVPHILVVTISRSVYLGSFSVVFNEVFLSDGTTISMSLQVLFLWSLITISGLLAAICLSMCIFILKSIIASLFSVTVHFHTCCPTLGCCSADMFSNVYMQLLCCVFEYTQFLQVQDSQTQCGLSFPLICCISCTLDQCRLV